MRELLLIHLKHKDSTCGRKLNMKGNIRQMNNFLYRVGTGMLISGGIVVALGGGSEIAKWIMPFGMVLLALPLVNRFVPTSEG